VEAAVGEVTADSDSGWTSEMVIVSEASNVSGVAGVNTHSKVQYTTAGIYVLFP